MATELDPILVLAPSGVAALNIHERTIHSALSLPPNGFSLLTGTRLATMRIQWTGIHFVIIDEKSMLGQHMALAMGKFSLKRPTLPSVISTLLSSAILHSYHPSAILPSILLHHLQPLKMESSVLYRLFTRSYRLQIVHRQLRDSPEQVRFRDLLRHASQGGLSREEWEFLDSRTERKLTPEVRKLFENATRNDSEDVNDLNLTELQALNQPCARINARYDGSSDAAKAPADEAGSLKSRIVLAKHAKVMITRNI
jgi:hypothetical protein